MGEPIIKRYFSEDIFEAVKKDFEFLIKKIISSGFEYDLQIRDNKFNLYYRGNSLAKVTPIKRKRLINQKSNHEYLISIHKDFFNNTGAQKDKLFKSIKGEDKIYVHRAIPKNKLHSFFQVKYLKEIASNIKKINYQEEITFEQMIITGNVNRADFIIIDRQVMESKNGTRMDILALKQKKGNDYQFCVIEVKLGNNPELNPERSQNVIKQLEDYVNRIKNNFPAYKDCYDKTVRQKQLLGLINGKIKINILEGVSGIVVIGGYSGIAKERIKELKQKKPDIKILPLWNEIDFSKII